MKSISKTSNKHYSNELEQHLLDEDFFFIVKKAESGNKDDWEQLLIKYPDTAETMKLAYRILCATKINTETIPEEMISEDWNKILQKIDKEKRVRKIRIWSSAAACLLVLAIGSFVLKNYLMNSKEDQLMATLRNIEITSEQIEINVGHKEKIRVKDKNAFILQEEDGSLTVNDEKQVFDEVPTSYPIQISIPYGKRSQIVFSDGSKAWVNSGTKLVYPSVFDTRKRDIYVDGEIFLEVNRKINCPFIVHTAEMQVEVTGTRFNVTAYSDDVFASVVLVEGGVKIHSDKTKEEVVLSPNYCLHYENNKMNVVEVDVSLHIGWKDGYLKLSREPLKNIFKKLSRYYDVDIAYDSRLADIQYKGKLDLSGDIENILNNIALTERFTFQKENREIKIMSND